MDFYLRQMATRLCESLSTQYRYVSVRFPLPMLTLVLPDYGPWENSATIESGILKSWIVNSRSASVMGFIVQGLNPHSVLAPSWFSLQTSLLPSTESISSKILLPQTRVTLTLTTLERTGASSHRLLPC